MPTSNDCVRLAIHEAVRTFGNDSDKTFNLAGLSAALCRLADVPGIIDGSVCRVILTGRTDVEPLRGGSHYRLLSDCG